MPTNSVILNPACIKTLAAVEARPERSNQHEFNGVTALKSLFGHEKTDLQALFSVRGESAHHTAKVTWYDSRENHPTRSEYRLYFQSNPVMKRAQAGDNMLIGFIQGQLHCILIPNDPASYPGWTPIA
ncbi:type II restriction endonuclease [Halomonas sp. BC1]|uniref:type II restriction endonuclease n=1 Tax=Halomonas sp. BC1 TaxID=1670448 RepID=UPI0009BE8ED9|nr:type II restriction endonuclease [Halomonas sp. BC1]